MVAPRQGDVATAGQKLFECAVRAGFGARSHVHAVGDGAQWIADQIEDQWKEAKICLAHPQGSKTLAYGGTSARRRYYSRTEAL